VQMPIKRASSKQASSNDPSFDDSSSVGDDQLVISPRPRWAIGKTTCRVKQAPHKLMRMLHGSLRP
jgi:hypothetical protein